MIMMMFDRIKTVPFAFPSSKIDLTTNELLYCFLFYSWATLADRI